MAGFLYYVPGQKEGQRPSLEDLQKAGIGYAFEDDRLSVGFVREHGPDEGHGAVVCAADAVDASMVKCALDKQSWLKIPGSEYWVGMYQDDPPKPADCVRKKALQGHWVECGDGEQWLAPVARALNEPEEADKPLESYCALPQTRTIDDNGAWAQGGIMPRYAALWDMAVRYLDALTGGLEDAADGEREIHFDFADQTDSALLCLAINYRIGKAEAVLLGLFTDESVSGILGASVDWPVFEAWVKKNTTVTDGLSTGDGPKA